MAESKMTLRNFALISRLCLGIAAVASPTSAWGPFTHQALGCQLLQAWGPQCYNTMASRSFVLGAAAPDAFKHTLPGGVTLHTFEFAGSQLLFAQQYYTGLSPDFDAVAYSRGFGAHLAADAVGHHSKGYLNREYDRPCP